MGTGVGVLQKCEFYYAGFMRGDFLYRVFSLFLAATLAVIIDQQYRTFEKDYAGCRQNAMIQGNV